MKYVLSTLIALALGTLNAQFFDAEAYDWKKAEYENVSVDDSTDIYVLLSKKLYNYYYDNSSLKEQFLLHKKMYINSSDAVDNLNTIYISQSNDNLVKFKARAINPAGKITEITEDKILKGVDEDSEQEYIYFAMEGLEIGSQIEYFYIKDINPNLNGVSSELQGNFPVKRVEFDIITPWNLVMASKVYNTDLTLSEDTTSEEQKRIYLNIDSLAPLKNEPTAFKEANLIRVAYKLDQNLYTGKKNLITYGEISQNVVNNVNSELSKKEIKVLAKIEKEIASFEPEIEVNDIRKIENYLKSNYQFVRVSNPVLYNIENIYKNKAFNDLGALILYTRLLKRKGIEYKMVYTSDRSEMAFDPDFETNIYLDELMLYFPEEDLYLEQTNSMSRAGYVSALYTGNFGLFIEEVALNDNVVAVATTEMIPFQPSNFTIDSMDVKAVFGDDLFENDLDVKRVLTGYTAGIYQPLLSLILDEDDKKDFEESILTYINSDAEVKDLEILNGKANLLGVKPLVAKGILEDANYMEKAGPNFLFKVGTLIGPQSEMYDEEEERKMDVESDHCRTYIRKITFDIPVGYEVSGLEALAIDEKLMYKEEISSRFVSTYTQEGNTVIINIEEHYNEIKYPKELFDDYKKVINAAADFNKLTLLFKKAS